MELNDSMAALLEVITLPPPTQQPTDAELTLSLLHIVFLTISLCGNVSQLVVQWYAKRFESPNNIQYLISCFLILNVVVCLSSPWIIVEILVKHWTFSRWTCQTFNAISQLGRTLTPYLIVFIYSSTASSIGFPLLTKLQTRILIMFVLMLLIFVTFPVAFTANLTAKYHGKPILGDSFKIQFETNLCNVPYHLNIYTKNISMIIEFIIPFALCVYFSARMGKFLSKRSSPDVSNVSSAYYYLIWMAVVYFSTSWVYYAPSNIKSFLFNFGANQVKPRDIARILPFLSTSLSWLPASSLSVHLSFIEIQKYINVATRESTKTSRLDDAHLRINNQSCHTFNEL